MQRLAAVLGACLTYTYDLLPVRLRSCFDVAAGVRVDRRAPPVAVAILVGIVVADPVSPHNGPSPSVNSFDPETRSTVAEALVQGRANQWRTNGPVGLKCPAPGRSWPFFPVAVALAFSMAFAPCDTRAAPGEGSDKPIIVLKVKPAAGAANSVPSLAIPDRQRDDTMRQPATAGKKKSIVVEPEPQGFETADQLLGWMTAYREMPDPNRLPQAIHAMSRLGLLRDMDSAGLYVGFAAGVLGANPAMAEALVTRMFPRPPEEQGIIIRAIAYSGLADWRGLLAKFVERMPARRKQIEAQLFGKGETLETVALDTGPAPIDTLWGYHFATGSFQPVERIISTLPWAADKSNVERLTIGGIAKWTLASNAMRDKALLDQLREAAAGKPKEVAAQLREIVVAAESFEVGRIRKDALASIEDVRRRGPERKRAIWATALNASPTVIGLACVAASVAGQVALGIPCVISGALSTAAAKHWGQ